MALEFGFYNSFDGDRRYNAEQMSGIFEGLITDGVYASVGEKFGVFPGVGLQVLVGTGRAFFKETWNKNKARVPLDLAQPDPVFSRIDAICIRARKGVAYRENDLIVYKGTIMVNPEPPIFPTEEDVHYLPLAYVTVQAGATSISAADIQILVGSSKCPFVTSILQQTDIDILFAQWDAQFKQWWEGIKEILDGDTVGNLLNMMSDKVNKSDVATKADIMDGTDDTKWVSAKGLSEGLGGGIYSEGDFVYPNPFINANLQNWSPVYAVPYGYPLKEMYGSSTYISSTTLIQNAFALPAGNNGKKLYYRIGPSCLVGGQTYSESSVNFTPSAITAALGGNPIGESSYNLIIPTAISTTGASFTVHMYKCNGSAENNNTYTTTVSRTMEKFIAGCCLENPNQFIFYFIGKDSSTSTVRNLYGVNIPYTTSSIGTPTVTILENDITYTSICGICIHGNLYLYSGGLVRVHDASNTSHRDEIRLSLDDVKNFMYTGMSAKTQEYNYRLATDYSCDKLAVYHTTKNKVYFLDSQKGLEIIDVKLFATMETPRDDLLFIHDGKPLMIWEDTYNCGYEAVPVGVPYVQSGATGSYLSYYFRFGFASFTNYIPRRRMYVFNYEKDLLPFYSGTFVPGKRLALGMGNTGTAYVGQSIADSYSVYLYARFFTSYDIGQIESFGSNVYVSGKIPFHGFSTTFKKIQSATEGNGFLFNFYSYWGCSYMSIFDLEKVPFMPIMGPISYQKR